MPAINKQINLKGLITQDSLVANKFKEKIKEFTGVYPKTTYGSTETLMCSFPSVSHPLGFIFDWRRGIFEFNSIKQRKIHKDKLLRIDEVKVGEIYQPIFTSFDSEITRYIIGDYLKCVSKGDDILGTDFPVFKYYSRGEKTISIQNFTRISEAELMAALDNAEIPYIDFTARVDIRGKMEYAMIYLEFSRDMPVKDIRKRIHKELYKIDQDYRSLVDFFDYTPIKVEVVPKGTIAEFL